MKLLYKLCCKDSFFILKVLKPTMNVGFMRFYQKSYSESVQRLLSQYFFGKIFSFQ
jgi:hypothetical protein